MKHIKEFNSPEEDLIGDLDKIGLEAMKGWIIVIQPYNMDGIEEYRYLCITAPNEPTAIKMALDDISGEDFEISEEEIESDGFETISRIGEESGDQSGATVMEGWRGLIPREKSQGIEVFFSANPYETIKEFESMFTNAREILTSKDTKYRV